MTSKHVPQAAMRCSVGAMTFAEPDDAGTIPVEILARTGDAISHWYWGEVVHDLSGMQHAERVPIDYNHDSSEMLGFLDEFEAGKDLVTRGELVPFKDGDRVDEVTTKARAGIPYEASIDFSGAKVELSEYGKNETVNVNGREFSGPITVIDRWALRAVAIAPYGADPNTSTSLSTGDETQTVSITREKPMTLSEQLLEASAKPEDVLQWAATAKLSIGEAFSIVHGQAIETDEKAASAFVLASGIETGWTWPDNVTFKAAEPAIADKGPDREEAQRFEAAFGTIGVKAWMQGKTINEAAELFAADQTLKLESADEENRKLKAKITALESASSDPAEVGDDPNVQPKQKLRDKMDARAAALNATKD